MRELFRKLNENIKNGNDCVLVSVIASSGSTPRGAGARMLVAKEGRICGTIGGGAVEYRSQQLAAKVLEEKNSCTEYFELRKNDIQDLGMICGGDVNVYFQYIPAGSSDAVAITDKIEELYSSGVQSWIISGLTQTSGCGLSVYTKNGNVFGANVPDYVITELGNKPSRIKHNEREFYCEKLVQSGRVYIFGGGHVAQALVPALAAVDFRCVVLEDREDFCRKELFRGVEDTILIDNERISDFVNITENDYVVIMTRGHKDDMLIEAQALKTPACYIGIIGSAKKTAGVKAKLRELGFDDDDFARVTTPIGLAIKAETPAEIAVSITAQLILVRAERMG